MNEYNNYDNTVKYVSRMDFLSRVYAYVGIGLGLSALGAIGGNYLLPRLGSAYGVVMFGLIIAELVLAFVLGRGIGTKSTSAVKGMFIAYSLINGLTLSVVLAYYTTASVLMAFTTTAVVFVSLAIIGKTTSLDLSRFGTVLMTGLIVSIVVSLVNVLFFRASGLDLALCYFEILLFMGLTAYDMQMIDRYYSQSQNENYAIYAALQLELDFINLLVRVLRIFGTRRSDD
ncbi:MAG: Bax inhibitor-1/YccA family protein [Erysipelotrichaceae bacterium]|nr:Bax inhibitor-1/YccA family protein [Erysipelotrichaceae bacterium]MBP5279788.1 Bax inhibitor-1/YccA family protein [Erysipelotrichaceae bacterium]